MAETISITTTDKQGKYCELLPQINALISYETDLVANLANITAALQATFNWLWVGFYLVKDNQLVLGPFQGPVACTRINYAKGVCGTAWAKAQSQVVPDVDKFPGHIACSSLAKSEIVVPVFDTSNQVVAVLDIDSQEYSTFDEVDQRYLEELTAILTSQLFNV